MAMQTISALLLNTSTTVPVDNQELALDDDLISTLGLMAIASLIIVLIARAARKTNHNNTAERNAPFTTSDGDDFSEVGDGD